MCLILLRFNVVLRFKVLDVLFCFWKLHYNRVGKKAGLLCVTVCVHISKCLDASQIRKCVTVRQDKQGEGETKVDCSSRGGDSSRCRALFCASLWRRRSWGGKKYSAEMCSKLARMVTILRQMLRCLKSSYKLRDSRWESVSANPTRVYHLSAGKGSEVETRFL